MTGVSLGNSFCITMITTVQDILAKIPVEILRGRVISFLTPKEAIRAYFATATYDHSNARENWSSTLDQFASGEDEIVLNSNEAVRWFLQHPHIQLSNIRFGSNVSDNLLSDHQLVRHANALSFNGCIRLSSVSMANMVRYCIQLQKLDLTMCRVQEHLTVCISELENLTTLSLALVLSITHAELMNIMTRCTKLRNLNLYGSEVLGPSALIALAPLCSALEVLDLSRNLNANHDALYSVCYHARSLRELNVSSCWSLDYRALGALAEHCHDLCKLDISNVRHSSIDDAAILPLSVSRKHLTEFKANGHRNIRGHCITLLVIECRNLQVLELSETAINDDILVSISRHCTELRRLNISSCQVTDAGVRAVAASCTTLTCLVLKHCTRLTDLSVVTIARKCCLLRELSISDCVRITDFGVIELGQHCGTLQVLNLSHCRKVSDVGVTAVAAGCQELQWVCLNYCSIVTDVSIVELYLYCRKMKVVQAFGTNVSENTRTIYGL